MNSKRSWKIYHDKSERSLSKMKIMFENRLCKPFNVYDLIKENKLINNQMNNLFEQVKLCSMKKCDNYTVVNEK